MREKIKLNRGWMFHKGDLSFDFPSTKSAAYKSAKTERALWGPACRTYDTSGERWERVDLPHDYVICELPEEKYNQALGYVPYDNAWYVKKFTLNATDKSRRITLFFEGVATSATVWVNGCLMKHNFCGYTSFEVDITDVAKYGEENTVAVYVNTQSHESWWYEGGGIYRHVWLIKTDLLSVDLWGVYANPVKGEGEHWTVQTEVTLRNDSTAPKRATLMGEILDSHGNVAATATVSGTMAEKDKRTLRYTFSVDTPGLWSPDSPTQYVMRTKVLRGKTQVDEYDVKFGFRSLRIDPARGLLINEKHYKIQGLCGHADCGLMGKAVPDNIHRYKVRLMKEMGANGYRTTHYPQAEALMDALDENGFIVMNETRWFESTEEGKAQLEMLVKRDRNRPGVVFWSVGNEEPLHKTEEGRRIAQTLMALVRKLDSSRFVTTAVWHTPSEATVYDELEVIGINYNWNAYDAAHEKYPNKGILSSENCATGTTRGHYAPEDTANAFLPAYDHDTTQDWRSREYTQKFISSRPWMMGGYQWIAFEHRGEAVWPRLCSQSGAIDLFLQRKDAFYQNQSHWTKAPMVHLLPHWSFPGREGEPITVFAYTNASRLELFLNGESLGVRDIEPHGHGEWTVPYTPGKLEVLAYDGNTVVAKEEKITAGSPARLMLTRDTEDVRANGEDIAVFSCYVVDREGNEVPNATPTVEFSTNGIGEIYSTGSDITDHTSLFLPVRKMRAGRIGIAVKMGDRAGVLKLSAHSAGLDSAELTVEVKE